MQVAHGELHWPSMHLHVMRRLFYARETDVVESINDPAVRENTTFLKVTTGIQQPPPMWNACTGLRSCMAEMLTTVPSHDQNEARDHVYIGLYSNSKFESYSFLGLASD